MKDLKRSKTLKTVRILAAGSLVAIPIKACSNEKSSFAELKISEEAQSSYDVYEQIKNNPTFKSHFEDVLKLDVENTQEQTAKSLIVKGVNFENAGQRLELTKKSYNKGYKGRFGDQLKDQGKNLGAVQPRDFQISQEILFDTLQAGGDKNRLTGLLKKYSDDDYRRAFRATLIMKSYERLVRDSDKKAALNLDDAPSSPKAEAIKAGVDVAKTVITTLPDLIKNINEGKWIDANGAALRSCSKEIDTCSDAMRASFNTKGQENYNQCAYENKPNTACNNGLVRDQMERENSDGSGLSNSFTGEGTCSAHYWRCYCSGAFKKNSKGDFIQAHHDRYGCNWQYNEDKKPDRPEVANLSEATKVCEAKTRCSVNVSVGKTN